MKAVFKEYVWRCPAQPRKAFVAVFIVIFLGWTDEDYDDRPR